MKLKAENCFWSYSEDSVKNVPDDILIEKTLVYLDLPDSQIGSVVVQWDDDSNEELGCDFIPYAWNIDRDRLSLKINELLNTEWVTRVKNGFIETLNTALE